MPQLGTTEIYLIKGWGIEQNNTQQNIFITLLMKRQTCSGRLVMSTPKALLKKEVRRGLRGGGLSKKEYILSSKAESEDNFSLICGDIMMF